MHSFFDLFARRAHSQEAWNDPSWADRQLPELLAQSPLRLWRPGDEIDSQGNRLLVGVATWSGYDMRLLDVMAEGLREGVKTVTLVDIFNMADCLTETDFRRYIHGIKHVGQPPVARFWHDGRTIWTAESADARDRVAHLFGSSSPEIVAFVMDWINTQRNTTSP